MSEALSSEDASALVRTELRERREQIDGFSTPGISI
jgi:uncharacterized protein YoaH (UPF0181 family)